MPRFGIHHDGLFFEWSTVSDAPTTCAMTRPEFEAYWLDRHGRDDMEALKTRLDRAVANGTSLTDEPEMTAEEAVSLNSLGDMDEPMGLGEIVAELRALRGEYGLPLLGGPFFVRENP